MKSYMIYCCQGAGGLFLTTVFAQTLGLNAIANFSKSGHSHDMGQGNWQGADGVCMIGDYWKMNYTPGMALYYSHVLPQDFSNKYPHIEIVKITADVNDYRKLTELHVKKAWPYLWTQEEYNKWVGPDYPPYSRDNIPNSDIIVNDLINDLEIFTTKAWYDLNATVSGHYTVDFKTIMGIDNVDLAKTVEQILGIPVGDNTKQHIKEYQVLNQKLYFND